MRAVTTFVFSVFVSHEHKLDMVHIQNSTLAGGVGVGAVCNLLIGPGGAAAVGFFSGLVSVLGYRYLSVSMLCVIWKYLVRVNLVKHCISNEGTIYLMYMVVLYQITFHPICLRAHWWS